MTGKWAYKNGFQNYELQHTDQVGVPLSNKLMGEHLQDNGYVCFSCRKKIEKEKETATCEVSAAENFLKEI